MAVTFSNLAYAVFREMMGGALVNNDRGFQIAGPGSRNDAGVSFTDERAMQNMSLWSGVRLVSETVGTLPLHMYRRTEDGREKVEDHPLADLFRFRPNAMMTPLEFREAMTANLALWGNAYAVIERQGDRVTSITPLKAPLMAVKREAGMLTYHYKTDRGTHIFAPESILHIKGFGTDGVVGLSPIQYGAQALGTAIATEQYAGHSFGSGGRPSGVLTVDKILTKEQREALQSIYQEVSASDGLWVLEGGTKYQAVSLDPSDMQMLQSRVFSVMEIARLLRVPPFLLYETEKNTSWGSGIEQFNLGFLTYSVRPYLTRWESAMCAALLSRTEQREYFFAHSVEGLLRADSAGRASFLTSMVSHGLMTRNEARQKENLKPVGGADELTVQVNMAPLDSLPSAVGANDRD